MNLTGIAIQKIVSQMRASIESIPDDEMDDASFRYEEGVLLTGREAELICNALENPSLLSAIIIAEQREATSEPIVTCGECNSVCDIVRPGKWQCPKCE